MSDGQQARHSDFQIDPTFLSRWSPRAFTQEEISEEQLLMIIEAARWAPSGFNAQPWRFIYVRRSALGWDTALDILSPYNRSWAVRAAALIFIGSFERGVLPGADKPTEFITHSFDAGAAWAFLAFQAAKLGIATHAIGGFDRERAKGVLNAPPDFTFDAVVALGTRGNPDSLPENLAAREGPSGRRPLSEIAFPDRFN
ncbi:MAG: hypothetical protein C3F11_12035 [Methylocystaceae bacterium]|nr:MAG: hypothetical protein C3F11_12035 [Methylocystaceae bacterium]